MRAALLLLLASTAAHAEPVAQAYTRQGGSLVITGRQHNCPRGQLLALDLRPAGARPAFVSGCTWRAEGGLMVRWRGWPHAHFYPLGAFRMAERDLSWINR